MGGGHGGSCSGPQTLTETGRARELQHMGRASVTHRGLACQQYMAQASCDYVPIRLAMPPFLVLRGMQVGCGGEESHGRAGKTGGWLGRSSLFPAGGESVPLRRGERFDVCCTLSICLSFVNETSGIRPAISWIPDNLNCLNPLNTEKKTRARRRESIHTAPLENHLFQSK